MNQFMLSLLMGASPAGQSSDPKAMLLNFAPIIAIIAIFYFLIIRPQNKKQKETRLMLDSLKKGDKVVTIGGVHGVVQSVKDSTVILKVDEDTKIEFSRQAISTVDGGKNRDDKKSDAGDKAAGTN